MLNPIIKSNIKIVNIKNHIPTEYDYYIGRPSILSNIYSHKSKSRAKIIVNTRDESIDKYKIYFYDRIENDIKFKEELDRLVDFYLEKGWLNLCCFCSPKRCHGEIIKEYLDILIYIRKTNILNSL